jgi:hypothetical protein
MAMNIFNFLLIAVDVAVVDGHDILAGLKNVYVPVLPVEFATGLLTAGVAYAYQDRNLAIIGLLAVVGLVFQYLLQTALNSMERKEQLEAGRRNSPHSRSGCSGRCSRRFSLRDKMTARHSAAVARYSREIARELGLSEHEQDVVHGGSAARHREVHLPRLDPLREHEAHARRPRDRAPASGAGCPSRRAYRRLRTGGRDHPRSPRADRRQWLPERPVADQIPLAARIISVADTYDVMTSRDSYRRTVSSREAIEELRRVSGAQLDAMVVETFVGLLEQRSVTFRHADDADFERELNLDRRVRDYAAPRLAAA